MSTIERIALVAHTGKPEAMALRDELTDWLTGQGKKIDEEAPDLVVSLGGDGTVLRAAQEAHHAGALLLGINLGALGYLTEVDRGDEKAALGKILAGDHQVEERMMLSCQVEGTGQGYVGLNEVLVERASPHRLVRLGVTINGEWLAAFNADGLIVATPTGSTAYALSAGGPIVAPEADCLVLVPVSAHMIFARPFVLAPGDEVVIDVATPTRSASLSLDGFLGQDLDGGDRITVRRHPAPLRMVRLAGPKFVERLRVKLQLPGEGPTAP